MIRRRLFLAVAATLALGACATTTPYQPLHNGEGYSEQRIESNRYVVRFFGNESTPRQTVENDLLYRAAELTLANGYDYFVVSDQTTEAQTSYYQSFSGGFGFGRFWWGPRLGADYITPEVQYEGNMTILMRHGKKREGDVRAFDAHEVQQNLEPLIVRPEDKKKKED
jgi:hypothetical protein